MIKAASQLFCLTLLLATAIPVSAQTGADVDAAGTEGIRRQADTILLHQKLALAQSSRQRGDLSSAAKLYEQCYTLVQNIGPSVEPGTRQVVAGLCSVLLDLA